MFGKNRKRFITIVAAILALLMVVPMLISVLTIPAGAATSAELKQELDDLKRQASGIEAQKAELEEKLDQNRDQTNTVVGEKYTLDQQIEITNLEIANTNAQIQQYNSLIAAKQKELDDAAKREEQRYEEFKSRIRAMEENGSVSYLSILFNASSFSDLLDRIDLIGEMAEYDQVVINELKQAREEVASAQLELEQDKAALDESRQLLALQEETLARQRLDADAVITSLSAQADEFEAAYEEFEAEEAYLQSSILDAVNAYEVALEEEEAARKAAEEARKKALAAKASSGSGKVSSTSADAYYYSYYSDLPVAESGFLFPLPAGVASVTSAFGYRIHPTKGTYGMHTGVDFSAAGGTNIYASKSGTVITSTMSSAYGNYVVVSHGSGQATLYAHMSSRAVSAGDYVVQGQTIGYVGTTGWSTGNHLHFEVIIDGEYQNPMSYVSVQ